MTRTPTEPVELPIERPAGRPFELPAGLAALRAERPLTRMRFPDGHLGWLATGYDVVRAVMSDPRFSVRYELLHDPLNDVDLSQYPAPPGDFGGLDAPEHTRLRRLLTGRFTVRRMAQLTARIEQISDEHLNAMRQAGPPADLVAAYAGPLPTLTICELLGVPYSDRPVFGRLVAGIAEPTSFQQLQESSEQLAVYLRELVAAKRAAPTDDILSELTTADLSDDELAGIGSFLLSAGMETTRSVIALSVMALLAHPGQFAALRTDPGLAATAVEELLRYLSILHTGVRAALTDVELAGQVITAGESVALAFGAANHDPHRFPDPGVLDVRRRAVGHVAFGHGAHQCLGQQLARTELRIAIPALTAGFPTLRLAIDPEDVPLRYGNLISVSRLPVTWEA
ncbi:cytochrome P450 [Nocardia sp. NPDC127526]|uniref:cytochrome P450 n=1 Tax=Nocardia sp. NPDC127526 TaxID=3345393 RepID=UPI00363CD8C6